MNNNDANDSNTTFINKLYSLDDISVRYVLTSDNLVYNTSSKKFVSINITMSGYPYVTLITKFGRWRKVTLHKIIALARICNGPYEIIEHLNDNPLDLRVSNLKFSTFRNNSLTAFKNGHRDCPAKRFHLVLKDGREFDGTMRELTTYTGIPRITLYDRYYKQCDGGGEPNCRSLIKSISLLEDAPPMIRGLGNRSIDYRKGYFDGKIILDNISIDYSAPSRVGLENGYQLENADSAT